LVTSRRESSAKGTPQRPESALPATLESSDAIVEVAVTDDDKGKRIDRFLVDALSTHPLAPSRAELARWIEHGRVTFARARTGSAATTGPAKAADKVRVGDVILVRPEAPAPTEALPDPTVVFEVVYVDDDLVVVDKPAGLVVHPAAGHLTGTLVNGLLARGYFDRDLLVPANEPDEEREDDEAEGPSDPIARSRPGVVHRIDKDTSGILVVARTAFAREKLKVQFAEHTCDRVYEALATGVVGTETYATLYGRNPRNRMMFSSKVRDGKRAVTRVTPKATFGALATHLECRLETGRTHQIRVHLADAGHSLLADRMYGAVPKNGDLARIATKLGRQALHARRLGFVHPRTGKTVVFESAPPNDFRMALEALRAMV
jgi:23S rRNA pseudouridine1911/1915/1917 synthase